MTQSGWRRLLLTYHPEAVSWWYFKEFDDGFAYARGGRVRSARAARKAIRDCAGAAHAEHRKFLARPEAILVSDGFTVADHLARPTVESERGASRPLSLEVAQ